MGELRLRRVKACSKSPKDRFLFSVFPPAWAMRSFYWVLSKGIFIWFGPDHVYMVRRGS